MKHEKMICPKSLIDILEIKEDRLYWKPRGEDWFNTERGMRMWNTRYAGSLAFTSCNGKGYKKADIKGVTLLMHRVVWAMHKGCWPEAFIDHINENKSDNRIDNLREATKSQNMSNRGKQSNNKSGYKGVSPYKGGWDARIKKDGKQYWLGVFESKEDAYAAYLKAAKEHHGEFYHG